MVIVRRVFGKTRFGFREVMLYTLSGAHSGKHCLNTFRGRKHRQFVKTLTETGRSKALTDMDHPDHGIKR